MICIQNAEIKKILKVFNIVDNSLSFNAYYKAITVPIM